MRDRPYPTGCAGRLAEPGGWVRGGSVGGRVGGGAVGGRDGGGRDRDRRDGDRRDGDRRAAAGRQRGGGGGLLAGDEGAELGDGGHQRGGEHHGGVLVPADLDQALQVPRLQGEGVRHHRVGRLAKRGGGQGLALGVDDLRA